MSTWLLIPVSFVLVMLLFVSTVFWVLLPHWFGVFGYKGKTSIGKRFIMLLMLFPVLAVGSLYIAWSLESGDMQRYIIFIPIIYIALLWFFRLDKNMRCFKTKQRNVQFFLDGLADDLKSFDKMIKNEDMVILSYSCLAPDKSIVKAISNAVKSDSQYIREYVSGGYLVNKVTFLEVYSRPLTSVDENEMSKRLKGIIEQVWDAGGEFGNWRLVSQASVELSMDLNRESIV